MKKTCLPQVTRKLPGKGALGGMVFFMLMPAFVGIVIAPFAAGQSKARPARARSKPLVTLMSPVELTGREDMPSSTNQLLESRTTHTQSHAAQPVARRRTVDLPPTERDSASILQTSWQQRTNAVDQLTSYEQRAVQHHEAERLYPLSGKPEELQPDFQPWWYDYIANRLRVDSQLVPVNVDMLVVRALQHSPQVQAVGLDPHIRYTAIVEEEAEFDWHGFVESTYDELNDPTGSLLTTGEVGRFHDSTWIARAGLRKKSSHGGKFEVRQKSGYQDNNSEFFVPTQQGTARLELNYTQPLLNGSGRAYNKSRIVLAGIATGIANDQFAEAAQDHLLRVTEAYWELYRARAVHLQKRKLLESAESILKLLEARSRLDAQQRQILRARAAVASRHSEIVRAEMSIRNAESRLRLLVNAPELIDMGHIELIPEEAPLSMHIPVSMNESLLTAIAHRPDVKRAIKGMRAASVQLGIARKDILPKLDLVLSSYVFGLRGNSDLGRAYRQQFTEGGPGYSVGLFFEIPLGNRAAKARHERKQLQARKALLEFQATVESGMTDVELVVREAETSYQEMLGKFQAMLAAQTETDYLENRWRMLPGDRSATQLLEALLDAQERKTDEEEEFVGAQVNYALALANLKRAMGTLLQFMDDGRHQDGLEQPTPVIQELSPPAGPQLLPPVSSE